MKALKAAFPYTIPIFAGYFPLGVACGIYHRSMGMPFFLPVIDTILVFSGATEFLIPGILLSTFAPFETFFLALAVGARHIFYGLTTLDIYKGAGWRKPYLIYSTADEAFSIHCSVTPPEDVDLFSFRFFVNILNQSYWVMSVLLGSILGSFLHFNTEGIEFVLTALFEVMFVSYLLNAKERISSWSGFAVCLVTLIVLRESFILPSLVLTTLVLLLLRPILEERAA